MYQRACFIQHHGERHQVNLTDCHKMLGRHYIISHTQRTWTSAMRYDGIGDHFPEFDHRADECYDYESYSEACYDLIIGVIM